MPIDPDIPLPPADAVLEFLNTGGAAGGTCALLTPAIKSRLRELQSEQVLEVRVDDPSAREDVAAWSRLSGHPLLAVTEKDGLLRFFIRKKTNPLQTGAQPR
jgi:tRNA 2-thiouridine synthesizing protein A